MSRLDELIAEYCPNGVEIIAVSELSKKKVINTITPTIKIKRNDYKDVGKTPIISQEIEYISGYCDAIDANIPQDNYVCFGDHSEHIKFVDFAFVQGADGLKIMRLDETVVNARFFYHAMSNFYVRHNNYERHFKYLLETQIPVPPLPVQREIVRILDSFSELTTELTTELTARKKQYEYYQNRMLDFSPEGIGTHPLQSMIKELCPDGVEHKTLGEVCEIRSGWGFPNKEQGKKDGKFPFFKVGDMNNGGNEVFMYTANNYIDEETAKRLKCNPAPKDTIIFPKIGAAIGTNKKRMLVVDSCYDNNVMGLIAYNAIVPRFLFYILESVDLMSFTDSAGAVPSIRKSTLEKYIIPVPPLPVQREIVKRLDALLSMCNDITVGLPAEIEARQKQYEYYRDELLTFKEATS